MSVMPPRPAASFLTRPGSRRVGGLRRRVHPPEDGGGHVAPQFHHWIVPIAVVIMLVLFGSQRFGTEKVGRVFGPVTLLWFLSIAARRGFRVDRYEDAAVGEMGRDAEGRFAMLRVTRRPAVQFSGEHLPTLNIA